MSRIQLATLLLAAGLLATPDLARAARADDPMASCPMHAQHSPASRSAATLDEAGDRVMGFDHARTTHHFLIEKDGGTIRVEVNDAADAQSREAIRRHLAAIAQAFATGDFSSPGAVHDRVLPGIDEMIRLKDLIHYRFEDTERGAQVRITTSDAQALAAVHSFLRAQIGDHRTGDPVAPPASRR